MENAIFIVTTLLFGKFIYWMHENRNNLGEAVKDVLQTFGLIVLVIAVIIALIAGVLWLLVEFIRAHPEILLLAFLAIFLGGTIDPPGGGGSTKKKPTFIDKVSKSLDESARRETQRERERMVQEIEDLKRERDSIPTYNGILMGGSGISEEKLQHNRYKRDKLDELIQDKERELYYFDLENRN